MQQTLSISSTDAATLSLTLDDDSTEPDTRRMPDRGAFEAAGITHPGRVRKRNEDAYGVFPALGLCAVADGLGGRAGGDVASALAVDQVRTFIARAIGPSGAEGDSRPLASLTTAALGDLLVDALVHANGMIHEAAKTSTRLTGMATTFVGALVTGGRAAIAHAGDSRAYLIRGGRAERLTTDHSMRELYLQVFQERARPEIAEQNASIVTRTLGARPRVTPDVVTLAVEAGDVILLCSDGLWGLVGDDEMVFALSGAPTLETALAKLMATAYNRGGHDNITAVLVRCAG